jgi:hypothetical protein
MDFKEISSFSTERKTYQKKFDIFGKDFSVKKSEKKNYFFDFFLIIFCFSWKTDNLNSKLPQSDKNMCSRHFNNFGKKNNLI